MANISYYEININTGKLSVETNNTSVTLLIKSLEEIYFNNTLLIVVYNTEGMSSKPTSKSFGKNYKYQMDLVVSMYVLLLPIFFCMYLLANYVCLLNTLCLPMYIDYTNICDCL